MTRRPKPLPRLSREGWEPAGPDRRVRSGMLIPKPEARDWPNAREVPPYLLGYLGPAERVALREIAATGDVLHHGGKTYLVAAVSAMTLDTLSQFEVDAADLDLIYAHDGLIEEDREPDNDDSNGGYRDDPDYEMEPESMSSPEFDPDRPVSRPTRDPGTLG